MNTDVMFSSASDQWGTPVDFFAKYHQEFRFTIDAAADASNHLLSAWFGPGGDEEDALIADWSGHRVWLNPPYSRAAEFLEKAVTECEVNDVPSCILLPSRTDTKYFHNFVYYAPYHTYYPWVKRVDFVKGRLKFTNGKEVGNSAPFPSMAIVTKGFSNVLSS